MSSNVFQEISRMVNIEDVAGYLGLTVNKAKFIPCPLHYERTPSCKLYPDQGRFWCFSCKTGGDSIALVAAVRGCSNGEAAAEIANYFNLSVDLGKHMGKRIRRKPKKQQVDINAEQLKIMADHCFDLHRCLAQRFGRLDALEDNLGDFCQRLLDDDDLRLSAPRLYYERYKNEFIKYGNAERKFFAIRDAIERSQGNGQPYPRDEILEIMGRT